MNLQEIIDAMEKQPRDKPMVIGFTDPHSYRGEYRNLAVEPVFGSTVGESLDCLKEALGSTYTGWKGGDYDMDGFVNVYISHTGRASGERIGALLLACLLGDDPVEVARGLDD